MNGSDSEYCRTYLMTTFSIDSPRIRHCRGNYQDARPILYPGRIPDRMRIVDLQSRQGKSLAAFLGIILLLCSDMSSIKYDKRPRCMCRSCKWARMVEAIAKGIPRIPKAIDWIASEDNEFDVEYEMIAVGLELRRKQH